MIDKECVGIIGGDMRMQYLAEYFSVSGHIVKLAGHDDNNTMCSDIILCNDVKDVADNSDIIILGLPAIKRDEINSPLYSGIILKDELIESLKPGKLVYGGIINKSDRDEFQKTGALLTDYCEIDEFAWLNAVSTAEGCIEIIMTNTVETINGLPCLIFGFGRIGKILADMLKKMNADVTVAARRENVLNEAEAFGFNTLNLRDLDKKLSDEYVIINTIPSMILNDKLLVKCKNKLIIDLASMPGGVDFNYAAENGIKVIHALGIPGKYAPKSFAKNVYNVILRTMVEECICG